MPLTNGWFRIQIQEAQKHTDPDLQHWFMYENLALQGWRSFVVSCGRESSVYSKKLQNFPSPGF
jgi:hypothetical protein